MEAKSVLVDQSNVEMLKVADDLHEQLPSITESSLVDLEVDNLLCKEGESVFGKDAEMFESSFLSTVMTASNYVSSDIIKKPRNYMIGVYTIFLTVSFVTMLKSVVEVLPFAFLKVGQDQGGAIDFTMKSDYSNLLVNGDILTY